MATLTTQNITRAGVGPTYAAAAGGGDSFTPDENTYVHIKNGGGGSITATFVIPSANTPLANVAFTSLAISVPNGGERIVGPFPAATFADSTDGLADITYSGVSSVTVGVFKLTKP